MVKDKCGELRAAPLENWLSHLAMESKRLLGQRVLEALPEDERGKVFERGGAFSPPVVSTVAWCGARESVRRTRTPWGKRRDQ